LQFPTILEIYKGGFPAMTIFICHYGCGKVAVKQNKSGNWMCDTSANKCPENKRKNSLRTKEAYTSGKRIDQKTQYKNLPEETKKRMTWSKGLTKDTDERVLKASIVLSQSMKGKPGRPHTEETKRKLSEKRIVFLENNSKHCEWFSIGGIRVQGSLEKKLAEFFVEKKIEFDRKKVFYQKHRRYTPDFYLPEYDFYVEVKGFLYEKDKEKLRNVLLENNIDIRIVFKQDIDKISTIEDLLNLKNVSSYITNIDYSKFKNYWDVEGNWHTSHA
jgi:hypothetical protein